MEFDYDRVIGFRPTPDRAQGLELGIYWIH
jgi:hypothetical protein